MIAPLLVLAALGGPISGDGRPSAGDYRRQAERCRGLLKASLLAFYLPASLDREDGGYLEGFEDGRFRPIGEKFLVHQARQLWFFSTLASEGIERDASLVAAKSGYVFLHEKMRDRDLGGYFARVSDSGSPRDMRKHAYLQAFALYGLVAYAGASGDAEALEAARALFRTLDAKAHDARYGGYAESFARDWSPIDDPKSPGIVGAPGTKTFNTHLHLLEAFAALYRAWPDPTLKSRLEELIAINTLTVRHPEFPCNLDGWRPDWSRIDTPANLLASYGHDIECTWLVLDAADALKRPPTLLRSWSEGLCDHALTHGFDREHGGFFYTGPPGRPAEDRRKEWWVQAEGLVAMIDLHRDTGRRDAFDAFVKTLDFVEKHQVCPEGGWYRAGRPTAPPWTTPAAARGRPPTTPAGPCSSRRDD